MDVTNLLPQLERLDGEIDNLEEVLQPLLGGISDVSSKLPLLDKAKLYVLVTYAIESMLFSSLRLNGVDAKNHPVFKELTRVRQYVEKIKTIENPPTKPEQSLNKEAAIRFIRADLADNSEVNTKLSEMIAKERAKAAIKAAQIGDKRKAETHAEVQEADDGDEDDSSDEIDHDSDAPPGLTKRLKKSNHSTKDSKKEKAKKEKKGKKKEKKEKTKKILK